MKFVKLGLIFTTVAIFIIACAQEKTPTANVTNNAAVAVNSNSNAQPAATIDELASARKIYSEKCVKCHKEDGTGGTTDIEGTKIKAPNFTSEKVKSNPDSDYIETIEKGAKEDGMPAYKGKISDDDIKKLVKFIRREFQGKS